MERGRGQGQRAERTNDVGGHEFDESRGDEMRRLFPWHGRITESKHILNDDSRASNLLLTFKLKC